MGYSISWVAFKGVSREVGLSRLQLAETQRTTRLGETLCSGSSLPSGWYLVVAKGCGSQVISPSFLSRLSADCEAVSGSVEEHVMYSAAEGWHNGNRDWRIAHDAQKARRHIECTGESPDSYGKALDQAKAEQDAEDAGENEVDFYFEIPLQVAKTIVGFKHDEECEGVDYDRFTVIERVGSPTGRPWWKFWK